MRGRGRGWCRRICTGTWSGGCGRCGTWTGTGSRGRNGPDPDRFAFQISGITPNPSFALADIKGGNIDVKADGGTTTTGTGGGGKKK